MVDECARIRGAYSVLKHVPEKLQKCANWMGDSVSRRVALKVIDDVSVDHDAWVLEAKRDVESLWVQPMAAHRRSALVRDKDIRGISFFGDNVGKVTFRCLAISLLFSLDLDHLH